MRIEEMMIRHGAPTLAGIKTASLFPVKMKEAELNPLLREANKVLTKKGIRVIPVRKNERNTLVYLYRPERLKADLKDPEAAHMLREKGYPCEDADRCIHCLIRHLNEDEDFPHEIGLFLGYPPSDVRCFMQDSREGVKCVGCWKAYSNEKEAEKVYETYKRCTSVYCRQMKQGRSLESLAVKDSRKKAFRAVI